jgi:putative DNA primase/helicase
MKTKARHIDTTGLPKGYDASDLIATGINADEFLAWCKDRVRPGPVPMPEGVKPKVVKTAPQKPASKPARTESSGSNVVQLRKPKIDEILGLPPAYSEDSLAERFSDKHENSLLYVTASGRWLFWDDQRWREDETGLVLDLSRKVCKQASTEAREDHTLGPKGAKIATIISSRKMFLNVAGIAQTDRRHATKPAQFDADPWILNTPEGVVDLKTGELRLARREDYASKIAAVGPGPKSKIWMEFLKRCTGGDNEMMSYLQRLAGYCLTGSVAEHAFFFVYGTGGNGKGTFANTIDWLLCDYARVSQMETFTEQRFAKHAAEIAYFQGARLVTAQETEEGKRWNESRIKAMTGGDPITANFMHQNPFTFYPQFKLLFTGNYKPALRNVDEAMKRRLHLVPFEIRVPEKERDILLSDKIRAEGSGVLTWAIEGCLEWQKTMLNPPERVLASTAEYFESEDTLGTFFEDVVLEGPGYRVGTTQLYKAYCQWTDKANEYTLPRKRFMDNLEFRGYKSVTRGGVRVIEGMRLQANAEDYRLATGRYPDQD